MGPILNCCSRDSIGKEEELKLSSYTQIKMSIGSYTIGLKTRLKELMIQNNLGGYIKKTIYSTTTKSNLSTPIHTEIIAGGTDSAINDFKEMIKEVVEENIDHETNPYNDKELSEEDRKKVIIHKTDTRISNRKASDAGDNDEGDDGLLDKAMLMTKIMKSRAKQVLKIVSGIPVLSQYTTGIDEQFSILVREMPKEIISAKSLFHPYSVSSFSMYQTDEVSLLKVCIEWKTGIPYSSIELFTMTGIPLIDTFTLMKDMQCIFADCRITNKFFESERELKTKMLQITKEPFVYHKMALHGMTMKYLTDTFGLMKDKMAQEIIQGDLGVSGVIALKIVQLIKKN